MEIQEFPVLLCRYESPRTLVQNCIFLPHLRARSCVLIVFSRYRSPCALPIWMTGCPEYPLTFRRNWTLHSRRTCQASEARFNVGFDFATILPSPFSSCILFAIVSGQPIELTFWSQQMKLKWLMLNKWRRLFHSSRVKFLFVSMSASWCLESTYLIRILESRLTVTQPIKSNSVGSGYVSHCWTSAFDDHFNHGFVILKNVQHRAKSGKLRVRQDIRAGLEPWFVFGCACLMWCYATSFVVLDLWCCWIGLGKNETIL